MNDTHKQVIVIRKDLNMRKGKMVAQGAHASVGAILNHAKTGWLSKLLNFFGVRVIVLDLADPQMGPWLDGRFKKITVYVSSEQELLDLHAKANAAGLIATKIVDSGLTEFNGVPTVTALAIGPDFEDKVDAITKHLPLL